MIEINGLTFKYPTQAMPVLQNVHLAVEPGTLTLVTGPSGSGKSTLLRCLNGLVPHFSGGEISGTISVYGKDPVSAGPAEMSDLVSFVFQEPEAQFVYDIVEDEIAFALENRGMPREVMAARVDEVCGHLNLTSLRKRPITEISGGEMQRVAIASALATQPKVLILDEPTSQLDPAGAAELLQYVVALKQQLGLTVLIAEHRLDRLLPFADQLIFLPDGGQVLQGVPRAILPKMTQVPPIVRVGKQLGLDPLALSVEEFPAIHVDSVQNEDQPDGPPDEQSLLKIQSLNANLAGQVILDELDLSLARGQVTVLIGPNGAGKTTLLRAIMGLTSSEGERRLDGYDMDTLTLSEVISRVAYLPQNPADLLFADSVEEELRLTLSNHNRQFDSDLIHQHLARFGLADKAARYPRDLSVGERQRTALAAITVQNPDIILLDEPTRGLDYANKRALAAILNDWRRQDKAILVTTQDVEFAAQLADRVILLDAGRVQFQGAPAPAFTQFPAFRTQTAQLFPNTGWYLPRDVRVDRISNV
ncbi:MAG: ATP-binding cassette domain-containing protein [Chloroflexota bacterium]|nr:ATP-binding cassette domain-containing protein [Chloroflexota bacterium]